MFFHFLGSNISLLTSASLLVGLKYRASYSAFASTHPIPNLAMKINGIRMPQAYGHHDTSMQRMMLAVCLPKTMCFCELALKWHSV